jgi:hypothetical protein
MHGHVMIILYGHKSIVHLLPYAVLGAMLKQVCRWSEFSNSVHVILEIAITITISHCASPTRRFVGRRCSLVKQAENELLCKFLFPEAPKKQAMISLMS